MIIGFCGLSVLSRAIFVPFGVSVRAWVSVSASGVSLGNVNVMFLWVEMVRVIFSSVICRSS